MSDQAPELPLNLPPDPPPLPSGTVDGQTSYAREYHRYLKGELEQKPDPATHGLTGTLASVIRTQCEIENISQR